MIFATNALSPGEEKFQSLGVMDIENLLPDLLDPNKQKGNSSIQFNSHSTLWC